MNKTINSRREKAGRSRYKGFYTAILISLAMVGAACAYAYQMTNNTLEENLSSLTELAEMTQPPTENTTNFAANPYSPVTTPADLNSVAGIQTYVPKDESSAESDEISESETDENETAEEVIESDEENENEEAVETISHILVNPIEGEVCNPFSNGELVKSETTGTWQTHNGADISAEEGTSVCSIDNGTVSEIVKDPLWGITVVIDHKNGIVSRYCNLAPSLNVKEGDTVESGQEIGTVGNTADAESKMEPHLYFEILKSGIYIDPMAFIES